MRSFSINYQFISDLLAYSPIITQVTLRFTHAQKLESEERIVLTNNIEQESGKNWLLEEMKKVKLGYNPEAGDWPEGIWEIDY